MIRKLFAITLATLAVAPTLTATAQSQAAEAAIDAAEAWLALVDHGALRESWKQTASLFRDSVSRREWIDSVQPVRARLGKLKSRGFKSATYRSTMPGAPDGDYFVIEFRAEFERKRSAIETVTAMRDDDGEWRVSGYYVE